MGCSPGRPRLLCGSAPRARQADGRANHRRRRWRAPRRFVSRARIAGERAQDCCPRRWPPPPCSLRPLRAKLRSPPPDAAGPAAPPRECSAGRAAPGSRDRPRRRHARRAPGEARGTPWRYAARRLPTRRRSGVDGAAPARSRRPRWGGARSRRRRARRPASREGPAGGGPPAKVASAVRRSAGLQPKPCAQAATAASALRALCKPGDDKVNRPAATPPAKRSKLCVASPSSLGFTASPAGEPSQLGVASPVSSPSSA